MELKAPFAGCKGHSAWPETHPQGHLARLAEAQTICKWPPSQMARFQSCRGGGRVKQSQGLVAWGGLWGISLLPSPSASYGLSTVTEGGFPPGIPSNS